MGTKNKVVALPSKADCHKLTISHLLRPVNGVTREKNGRVEVLRLVSKRRIDYSVYQMNETLLSDECDLLARILGERPVLMIVDENIERLYGQSLRRQVGRSAPVLEYLVLSVNERVKNLDMVAGICAKAQALNFCRNGVFIGIGGGVLLDIVGLAASIFRRGVSYLRIPTTIIGQVDVGVGIKQGVNFGDCKNLIGTFYPPLATINDPTFFATLPLKEVCCGLAEILKIAIVKNKRLFDLLEGNVRKLVESRFTQPVNVAKDVIVTAALDMMQELQPNLYEENLERLVDFGHTFSPTIERISGYTIAHGEAVAMDIALSCCLAVVRSKFSASDWQRVFNIYQLAGMRVWAEDCPGSAEIYESLEHVKAHRGGRLNLVIPREIGRGDFLCEITLDEIELALDEVLKRMAASWEARRVEDVR